MAVDSKAPPGNFQLELAAHSQGAHLKNGTGGLGISAFRHLSLAPRFGEVLERVWMPKPL
jgi:hypothetical protein